MEAVECTAQGLVVGHWRPQPRSDSVSFCVVLVPFYWKQDEVGGLRMIPEGR